MATRELYRKTSRRPPRAALALIVLGAMTVLLHRVIPDYLYGVFMTDGIYIPDATYKVPDEDKDRALLHNSLEAKRGLGESAP